MLTITKEELAKEGLTGLKTSLFDGMNQIRNSIHNEVLSFEGNA